MSELPDSIKVIAEVIGVTAALKLVREWPRTVSGSTGRGRIVLYVPTSLPSRHQLIDVLGEELAQLMVKRFGGELLFLASGHSFCAHERRDMIARAVLAGMPRERVALHYEVSQTTIKRAMRGASVAMQTRRVGADDARMHTTNRANA